MAGDHSSWTLIAGLALIAFGQPIACDSDTGGLPPVSATIIDVLEDVWPEVIQPALSHTMSETEILLTATQAWADAEAAGVGAETAREQAQIAWWSTMSSWQELEMLQIGPTSSSLTQIDGQDLRDEGYSWPTVSRCSVDQQIVAAEWDESDFFQTHLVNTYGLDALESLLFTNSVDNTCPGQVAINAQGTWDALTPNNIALHRAEYAVALSQHLTDILALAEEEWSAEGGNFAGTMSSAGSGNSTFGTPEDALNTIIAALFYLDTHTKDRKLGGPLGRWDCGNDDCLAEVETTLAGGSNEWIAANLTAFRALFTGGSGAGLDDLLVEIGHVDLVDEIEHALDVADAAAAALEQPIDVTISIEPARVEGLHDAVRTITDLMKEDIVTLLALRIPNEASGDND